MKTQNLIIGLLLFSFTFLFAQYTEVAIDTNSFDQSEVTIAISPVNSNYLKASWNDYRTSPPNPEPGYAFSTDGGNTWNEGIVPDTGNYIYGIDPSSAFDNFGNAFYCYLAWDANHLGPIMVSRTRTFISPFSWHHAQVSDLPSGNDKPFIAVDNTTNGNYSHNGRIYVSWMDYFQGYYRIRFSFSADSGKTFSLDTTLDSISATLRAGAFFTPPPDVLPGNPSPGVVQGAIPSVGPNGEVYVVWMRVHDFLSYNGGSFWISKSTDGGETFDLPDSVTAFTWARRTWGSIDHSNLPSLAVDFSYEYLYVAYKDSFPHPDSLPGIKFVRSTNGGNGWSQPKVIGNDLGGKGEVFPWVACDIYGKVAVTFMHRGDDDSVDCYIVESYDHGANFRSPVRVSSISSDPGQSTAGGHHYQGMVLDNVGNNYVVWTDYRSGNADPYFAKVNTPPAAPTGLTRSIHEPAGRKNPRIDWNANIETDFHHYEIWKKKGNGNWTLLTTTTNTYYIDTGETGASLLPLANGIEVSYKIKAVDLANNKSDFSSTVTFNVPGGAQEKPVAPGLAAQNLPDQFILLQNYPNPFNPATTIQFGLPEKSQVQITVYNIAGELVTTLANGEYPAGYHQVIFDASQLASGIYLYRIKAGEFVQTRKMMVLK